MLHRGNCLDVLKGLEECSIDALITDPPAGISFMEKKWDTGNNFIPTMTEAFKECLRVMKPGAHGLVWALPRTSHWTATALELAGFEIRDVITHLFGSGFPKSHDISKGIDKAAGAERVVLAEKCSPDGLPYSRRQANGWVESGFIERRTSSTNAFVTAPSTEQAKQWQGWGTALKPASEFWILIRKPLSEKTIAANVLKHGTGGINIDACRIEGQKRSPEFKKPESELGYHKGSANSNLINWDSSPGRFPANLVLDEVAAEMLEGSTGGASRFFYCAKASKKDRNEGCFDLVEKRRSDARPNSGDLTGKFPDYDNRIRPGNHHPTVKSTKLMEYLITLITPPKGIVLDPFMGSGSTGVAAKRLGFEFTGIEKNEEYFEIAEKRVDANS